MPRSWHVPPPRSFFLIALPLSLLHSGPADATSFVDTTPAEALEEVGVVMQATVVDIAEGTVEDGDDVMPVRYHSLEVGTVHVGSVSGERLRLVLPGGHLPDGRKVVVPGTPTLSVGDQLLAVFHSNGDDIVRIDRWQTGWFVRGGSADDAIATTAWGDPIVSIDCDARVQIARPWTEAASVSTDGPAECATDVDTSAEANPMFVDDPASVALSWSDFVEDYQACITAADPTGVSLVGTSATAGGAR